MAKATIKVEKIWRVGGLPSAAIVATEKPSVIITPPVIVRLYAIELFA